MFPNRILVLGGVNSGKSALAEKLAHRSGKSRVYLASAQAGDAEMRAKIQSHQTSRGTDWHTIEEPLNVASVLNTATQNQVILFDCATLWLSNQMFADADLDAVQTGLTNALDQSPADIIIVSNEVGQGGVAENALARRFAQAQGRLNQDLATHCDLVVLVAAGLPLVLRGAMPDLHE